MDKIPIKLATYFIVTVLIMESMLMLYLFQTIVQTRINEEFSQLMLKGSNHRDVLEDNFSEDTCVILYGWETCKRIREKSAVPILMLTAWTDKSDIVKGLNVGADEYLTKPFDDQELIARVNVTKKGIWTPKAKLGF